MKWSILFCAFFLAGCNIMPAKPKWPDGPAVGTCPDLKDAISSEKLSTLLETVSVNYAEYHKCRARIESWQKWYDDQKEIYEKAK